MAIYDRPYRLRVMDGLVACLEGITPANGYKSDLSPTGGRKVFRGRNIFGENDPLPMLSILETPLPIEAIPTPEAGTTQYTPTWDLLIQGFVQDDPEDPTDPAHILVADVLQALAKERKRRGGKSSNIFGMNGKVDDIVIANPVVRPPDELSSRAQFWLRITLKIVEDMESPYQDT